MSQICMSFPREVPGGLLYRGRACICHYIIFSSEWKLQQRRAGNESVSGKYGKKQIHVVDSESASCGETQIVKKLVELEEQGLPFEEIVKQIEEFRSNMHTYFVLDNLETLRKNGRLTGVKALVASTLSIKPIMAGDKGNIVQRGQSIGMKKALRRMAEIILEEVGDTQHRTLMITHCNAPDRAETIKKLLTDKVQFRDCLIMDTRGVSSMYANDGGVIVTV